jgi:hydroxyacyl-ACP dehydratase HTD2-like protein with hotdog domain
MHPTKFRFIWQSVSEEKNLKQSANQHQELSVAAMFVNGSGRNEQLQQRTFHRCFLPSFGSFGQTVSEEKNLKNQPIRNKRRLWRPGSLTDRDEMSNIYGEPSIDGYYQVSVHLVEGF